MRNISKFNQFFESKKLHKVGIPESIFSFLFKEKLFRNNDVDLEEIKTKKELKQIIRHEHILAIKDEDNFIFIHKEWDYHIDGKIDSSQYSNKLSLTSTLALITKEYKIYKVLNNNKIYKKYKKHENTESYHIQQRDVDEKIFNLVKKHLKKLRKVADAELVESLNDYRYSDFYGFHSSRDLLTRKEKRMKKSKSFNL